MRGILRTFNAKIQGQHKVKMNEYFQNPISQ
jgi:hypothetical protein